MTKRNAGQEEQPKILVMDIETAPGVAYIWRLFGDNFVPLERLISPSRVISWGAQWYGSREVMYSDEKRAGTQKMLAQIHRLMSQADAYVTFNGDKFDIPMLSGAFVEQGFDALPPTASIDLYKTVKKLGLMSGKLEFVAPFLKIGQKVKHEGFGLWRSVLAGDREAWGRMRQYNIQDVRLTSKLYSLLLPYIKNHPRLFPKVKDRPTCRVCSSSHIIFRGSYFTKENQYTRTQCQDCGSWDKFKRKPQKQGEAE